MFFVSYYTPNYQPYAARLENSLKKFNLCYCIEPVVDTGVWDINTKNKPKLIKKFLSRHQKAIWTDADSKVLKYPALFESISCDIGFHQFQNKELLSGTVIFCNTPKAHEILDRWQELNFSKNSLGWDQTNLQHIVETDSTIDVYHLPPEYCCIFDRSKEFYQGLDPVTEHYQASRNWNKSI
jgi:hypothetical protein